jgi:hypothetical protein
MLEGHSETGLLRCSLVNLGKLKPIRYPILTILPQASEKSEFRQSTSRNDTQKDCQGCTNPCDPDFDDQVSKGDGRVRPQAALEEWLLSQVVNLLYQLYLLPSITPPGFAVRGFLTQNSDTSLITRKCREIGPLSGFSCSHLPELVPSLTINLCHFSVGDDEFISRPCRFVGRNHHLSHLTSSDTSVQKRSFHVTSPTLTFRET